MKFLARSKSTARLCLWSSIHHAQDGKRLSLDKGSLLFRNSPIFLRLKFHKVKQFYQLLTLSCHLVCTIDTIYTAYSHYWNYLATFCALLTLSRYLICTTDTIWQLYFCTIDTSAPLFVVFAPSSLPSLHNWNLTRINVSPNWNKHPPPMPAFCQLGHDGTLQILYNLNV